MNSFGSRLKKFRQERRLTLNEVAKHVGVPMTTYRDWEKGRAVTGEPYLKLAKVFGVSLNVLMSRFFVNRTFDASI